jgi:anaerobic ribonucleoside-triphosphate reductase activating protein
MHYFETFVSLGEVPSEISLCIAIAGCPRGCVGCFWKNINDIPLRKKLTVDELESLLEKHNGVSCVTFLGGDWLINELREAVSVIKSHNLSVALYSGDIPENVNKYKDMFDYIKIGPYNSENGGLTSKSTNQKFFKKVGSDLVDITCVFNDVRMVSNG